MTLQELYDKVMASDDLKKSFAEAAQDKGKLEAWLKANGSDATIEQLGEFLKSKKAGGEVSDDELENVAGGSTSEIVALSTVTAGIACVVIAVDSAKKESASRCFEVMK